MFIYLLQNIPGVCYFFGANDIPGKNSFTPADIFIPTSFVENVFVEINSKILFNGQPVGIILAETMDLANIAAEKVKLIYIEPKKGIITIILLWIML